VPDRRFLRNVITHTLAHNRAGGGDHAGGTGDRSPSRRRHRRRTHDDDSDTDDHRDHDRRGGRPRPRSRSRSRSRSRASDDDDDYHARKRYTTPDACCVSCRVVCVVCRAALCKR
jgi:Ni/Co efflux regulator RcnB